MSIEIRVVKYSYQQIQKMLADYFESFDLANYPFEDIEESFLNALEKYGPEGFKLRHRKFHLFIRPNEMFEVDYIRID